MSPEAEDYLVGFGKPPRDTRFRRGVSGNPKGRPKGRANLKTILERMMQEKVTINENGVRKRITKLEAAMKQLANQAASGDRAAIRQVSQISQAGPAEVNSEPKSDRLDEIEEEILRDILKNFKSHDNGDDNEPNK